MKDNFYRKNGFTLIETIVAIGIFALMMSAISVLFISLYRSQKVDISLIERAHSAGRAIEIMSGEIREANRAENGSFHLATAESQRFIFYSDIDEDDYTEKITYSLEGTDLKKTVVEPGTNFLYQGVGVVKVVCGGVKNGTEPIFLYYDESYTGNGESLAYPVDNVAVKMVGINLFVNSENSGLSSPLHIETKVQIRNLK